MQVQIKKEKQEGKEIGQRKRGGVEVIQLSSKLSLNGFHSSRGERGESKENRDKSDAPAKVTVISGVARVAVS